MTGVQTCALPIFHIELSSHCNAACPQCVRNVDGGLLAPNLKLNSLSLVDIKKIFSVNFLQQIRIINLCGNYGDPIMCKDMYEIVHYIMSANKNIYLYIKTNGGARDTDFWTKLGKFSAENKWIMVVFGIDGLEDTNHIYRRNVNWANLMNNVQAYISAGGKAQWDYLVFAHNEHQLEEAKTLADRKSTRLNSSHIPLSRMPSSA